MPISQQIIFILWGNQCDEVAVVLLTSELRQMGLCVKIVSVGGRQGIGLNGISIVPNLTLGQALRQAHRASCIIIPCDERTLQRFHADPRLQEFLAGARNQNACIVVREPKTSIMRIASLHQARPKPEDDFVSTVVYPTGDALMSFAHRLAQLLLSGDWNHAADHSSLFTD